MHNLLGDRFLKKFAGEIRRRLKYPTIRSEGEKLVTDHEMFVNPDQTLAKAVQAKNAAGSQMNKEIDGLFDFFKN
ncbi:MAG TPA: hypothetical protein VMT46_00405 [Anaerolineaceae bacterium]|nr:hypothetical protein [Anaerolineaceae bacterium]